MRRLVLFMNIFFRTPRAVAALALSWTLFAGAPIEAQRATGTLGGFQVEFDSGSYSVSRGARVEGHVRLFSPQPDAVPFLDLTAGLVTADSVRPPLQARAQNGVSLVYRTVQAGPHDTLSKINVQARAQNATLEVAPKGSQARSTLKLSGNVDGFYEVDGARSSLKGSSATLSFGKSKGDVEISVEGGAEGTELKLPAQTFGPQISLGVVTLNAGRIDRKGNSITVEGGARGARLKSDGPAVLQVSAPAFDALLSQGGDAPGSGSSRQLSRISSRGRASISLELPPEDAGKLFNQPSPAQPKAPAAAAEGAKKADTSTVPVRFQVSADSAVIEPSTQILTLEGNVQGTYVLREVAQGQAAGEPTSYPFSGSRAILRLMPATDAAGGQRSGRLDFNLDVTGKPVSIELPAFNLGP